MWHLVGYERTNLDALPKQTGTTFEVSGPLGRGWQRAQEVFPDKRQGEGILQPQETGVFTNRSASGIHDG